MKMAELYEHYMRAMIFRRQNPVHRWVERDGKCPELWMTLPEEDDDMMRRGGGWINIFMDYNIIVVLTLGAIMTPIMVRMVSLL